MASAQPQVRSQKWLNVKPFSKTSWTVNRPDQMV